MLLKSYFLQKLKCLCVQMLSFFPSTFWVFIRRLVVYLHYCFQYFLINDYLSHQSCKRAFFNDFVMFSDLSTRMEKLFKMFSNLLEYGINLNPNKCDFMVISLQWLWIFILTEGKLPNPKKIHAFINMHVPIDSRFQWSSTIL